ncbi:autotransporter outer membrane beta-barrel domain-containing protein [Uliginosibacterium sp. sgz301328]|uniref:autotransporter outer membrane beta-barrel domain-containing protein n=1 Tax=Uliginosibacterium sp. sgz301328 TaxID=3243764 RepID=UPI00359D3421
MSASFGAVAADPPAAGPSLDELRGRLTEQQQLIEKLKQDIQRQEQELSRLRQQIDAASGGAKPAVAQPSPAQQATPQPQRAAAPSAAPAAAAGAAAGAATAQSGQNTNAQQAQAPAPQRTGTPPPAQTASADDYVAPPAVAPIFEGPGVLTPKGKWVVEPSYEYSYASSNRIALVGYTVIPAILIGLIDVREVKRNTMIGAFTVRRGFTNRFEMEARIPYVYRFDSSVSREVFQGSAVDSVFDANGKGIGDVEVVGRYQFNNGGIDKPFYIGSLRFKSRTGKDPFEVETNRTLPGGRGTGLQTELPTGTGFYSLQPTLTVLYPSDPAVFFANLSYQYSFKRNNVQAKTDTGWEEIGSVQPGAIWEFGFGMGMSINERASFSIGYDQQSVGRLKQNGQAAPASVRVQLASLLLGFSYRLTSATTLNISLGAGLTSDSQDLQLTVRLPIMF